MQQQAGIETGRMGIVAITYPTGQDSTGIVWKGEAKTLEGHACLFPSLHLSGLIRSAGQLKASYRCDGVNNSGLSVDRRPAMHCDV